MIVTQKNVILRTSQKKGKRSHTWSESVKALEYPIGVASAKHPHSKKSFKHLLVHNIEVRAKKMSNC